MIPRTPNTCDFLGSEFAVGDTLSGYFAGSGNYDNDQAFFWNGGCTSFIYSSDLGEWDSFDPQVPLMTAFFFRPSPISPAGFIVRTVNPPLSPSPQPFNLPAPNQYYPRSNWHSAVASYSDLVGLSSVLNNRTFVWPWNPTAHTFDTVFRWTTSLLWQELALPSSGLPTSSTGPTVPTYYGAFVGYFTSAFLSAPALLSVQAASTCPPIATLALTFFPPMDPITAANPASYKILKASVGCGSAGTVLGGQVQSVSVQGPAATCCGPPSVTTVVLTVNLYSQPCNQYFVQPTTNLRGLGGAMANTGSRSFTLCNNVSLANDHPLDALDAPFALVSPAHVTGSLTCADATPTGLVQNFPSDAGNTAKDVWYSFTPGVSGGGIVTVDTCPATSATCPESNTSLAVYQRNAAGLIMITPPTLISSVPDMGGSCGLNPGAAQVMFNARACATYYIRVAGKVANAASPLPGSFTLNLVQAAETQPLNDLCSSATQVSPNSSTRFDNYGAGTDGPIAQAIANDVWFVFQGPFGGGLATVETCTANFNTALAVYSGTCNNLHLVPLGFDPGNNGGCPPFGSQVTFTASASTSYYIRVGARNGASIPFGCGSLHVSCAIPPTPPPNTLPTGAIAGTGTTYCKTYQLVGTGANVPWTWSLTAPPISASLSGLNVQDTISGVANNAPALVIATAFAQSINTDCGSVIVATAFPAVPPDPDAALLQICSPYPQKELVLKVGSSLPPTCWVDYFQLNTVGGAPCAFNPQIYAIGDPDSVELDCNGNGQADFLDILQGVSSDVNGDGIPDECQGCIGVVISGGPDPTIGNLGGTATFAVHPLGTGPFSYQWRKDGTPLPGENNASLVLNNLPPEAAGLYDAIVTNACGQITSPGAVLFVDPQPVLNVAQAGSNVVLSWSTDEYHLQANPALNNATNWTDLPGASPVTVPIDAQVRYFRLVQNP
jgi:hypothetical protein